MQLLCDNNHSALTVQEFVMKKTFTFSLLAIVFASLLSACVPTIITATAMALVVLRPQVSQCHLQMVDQITAVMVAIN